MVQCLFGSLFQLRSVYFSELNTGQLDNSSLEYLSSLMLKIKSLVLNDELYQILLLISLLDLEGLVGAQEPLGGQYQGHGGLFAKVVNLRQTYLRLFQRKYCKASDNTVIDYTTFNEAAKAIKAVAKFLEFF